MSAEHPEASSARRHVLLALKVVVSIVLLALLFSKIDVGQLWAIARRASVPWFGAALGVYSLNMIASTAIRASRKLERWRWTGTAGDKQR